MALQIEGAAMRIRSEPIDTGPRAFVPPPTDDAAEPPDPARFAALAAAVEAAFAGLAGGCTVTVAYAGWDAPDWATGAAVTAVAPSLAAAVTAIRFGGTPGAGDPTGGVAAQRTAARLAAALAGVAARGWPDAAVPGVALDASLDGVPHSLWLAAPPRPVPVAGQRPTLAAALFDQPFRMPLAVSSEMVELAHLLPCIEGVVWPIAPQPVVTLAVGGQRVARVRIEPTPDGRQQAVVVAAGQPQGDRA